MGRGATKANGNVWYQARINASKWNERLSSREGAAEALHMSVDAVTDAELGLSKVMPVDKAVLMADLYNAPQLLNHYCLHECPIGKNLPVSDEVPGLAQVTVSLLKSMSVEHFQAYMQKLLDVADDGAIDEAEVPVVEDIIRFLDQISVNASKLKNVLSAR